MVHQDLSLVAKPKLGITLGDPAGIGPEVILKALAQPQLQDIAEFTVIGDRNVLLHTYAHLCQQAGLGKADLIDPQGLSISTASLHPPLTFELGQPTVATGNASFAYLSTAITQACEGELEGIVTGPIAKSVWQAAGYDYPGQTELLAEAAQSPAYGMLFAATSPHTGWPLRVLLATAHIPLSQVPKQVTPDLLTQKLEVVIKTLAADFGIEQPQMAIAGLNPHSGEQGQIGREEVDWLVDWVQGMRLRYPQITLAGPIPPDTLWVGPGQAWYGQDHRRWSYALPTYDLYIALYHDQGLIPVKLMAFDRAVNTTIGLPFVRTSPDHGTAFDIAGRGMADPASMVAALQLGAQLVRQRQQYKALK